MVHILLKNFAHLAKKYDAEELKYTFPLSQEGISQFKALDLARIIKDATHSDDTTADFTYQMNVVVNIDDVKLDPFVEYDDEEIPKPWDEVEKTLKKIVEAYDRIFVLASTGKPDGGKHAE